MIGTCFPHDVKLTHAPVVRDACSAARSPCSRPARALSTHQSLNCRCVLVAHDWGAFVAWFTAALYPAAVQKLIIMGLPHPTAWKVNLDFNQMRR